MPGTSRHTARHAARTTVRAAVSRTAITLLALAAALTATGVARSHTTDQTHVRGTSITAATPADSTTPDTSCAYCWGA